MEINSEENHLYIGLTDHSGNTLLPIIGKGEAAAIALTKKT